MAMTMALSSHSPPSLQIPSSIIPSSSLSRKHLRVWEKSLFGCGGDDHLTLQKFYCPNASTHTSHPHFKCFSRDPSRSDSELQFERLFSNLNQATFKREPGSLSSAIVLVAGTTVGAGILALPAVTQESGFLASAITCIFSWVYMLVVHFYTLCSSCCLCRPFLRYFDKLSPYSTMGKCSLIFFGPGRHMLPWKAVASGDLQWDALLKANFQAVPMSIPIIVLSFVYQNVVPVLCTDLEGNLSKIRTAIILGTTIPLVLFLVWNAVILGTITNLDIGADKMIDPLQQLQSSNGAVGPIVEAFSLLAIATSYIGFVLGLSDFLADLLKLPADQGRPVPYLLTLLPPLTLSLLDPDIFFKALDFAGTYGVLVLFGIVPAAMSWSDRYSASSPSMLLPQLVPGGKITLSIILGGAGYVIFSELLEKFGHP
ncbi:uncharacterized protein LOC133788863 isoform X4 [Humulus lupulus]|uniref:uncharacterized protein LOC133788863 isoform X4 n=1 Tax=Humulus lupulus TaxID=3486 RepID=UPI002B411B36|nr:uncharacterized protein LOC133788863 isoform X4 [Humulus lupulus]